MLSLSPGACTGAITASSIAFTASRHCSLVRHDSGYSLLEALITLTIIGIITSSSTTLLTLWHNSRTTVIANQLVLDLNRARSEAVTRRQIITLCQSQDGRQCGDSDHWEQGWILFTDRNTNKRVDRDERVLYTRAALTQNFRLRWRASGQSNNHVSYFPWGGANKNGSFTLCPGSGLSPGRVIILIRSGRARTSRHRADGSPPECPTA